MKPIGALATVMLVGVAASSGCMTVRLAAGERGKDTSPLRIGATRDEVEASFGRPVREWDSPDGATQYAVYVYDGGRPSRGWKAIGYLPLDLLTLGFLDPFVVGPKYRPVTDRLLRHETLRVVVRYDPAGKVSGIPDWSESPYD